MEFETKTCGKCRQQKYLAEFYRNRGSKDGRQGRCVPCSRQTQPYRPAQARNLTCVHCGNIFSARHGRLYCDDHQNRNSRYSLKPRIPRNCASCGREFITTPGGIKRYCGEACRPDQQRKIKLAASSRFCPRCGNSFLVGPRPTRRKWCSNRCKNWSPAIPEKTCTSCQRSFLPGRQHQIICSGCKRTKTASAPETRCCRQCSSQFVALPKQSKLFCSKHCAKRYYNHRRNTRTTGSKWFRLRPPCELCGFVVHTDNAHIVPSAVFGPLTRPNILSLCPNHHYLFDHDKLNESELVKLGTVLAFRNNGTTMLWLRIVYSITQLAEVT